MTLSQKSKCHVYFFDHRQIEGFRTELFQELALFCLTGKQVGANVLGAIYQDRIHSSHHLGAAVVGRTQGACRDARRTPGQPAYEGFRFSLSIAGNHDPATRPYRGIMDVAADLQIAAGTDRRFLYVFGHHITARDQLGTGPDDALLHEQVLSGHDQGPPST